MVETNSQGWRPALGFRDQEDGSTNIDRTLNLRLGVLMKLVLMKKNHVDKASIDRHVTRAKSLFTVFPRAQSLIRARADVGYSRNLADAMLIVTIFKVF